jgi:hypothetical protein
LENVQKGNFQEAVDCCVIKSKRDEIFHIITNADAKGLRDVMIGDLKTAEKDMDLGTIITLTYFGDVNGQKVGSSMSFVKILNGKFLIESL